MGHMRGIDISNWQNGINPLKLSGVEFCICKATEGLTYVSPDCDRVVQLCRKGGLPWGFYHFGRNNDAVIEADWFISNCKNYFGEGIPVLDWEDGQSVSWVNQFVQRVYERTKVWLWVYGNPWRFDQGKVNENCGRWLAQYPSSLNNPGIDTALPERPTIKNGLICAWQFASDIRISGWNGNLDGNIFYGDKVAWEKYAKGKLSSTSNDPLQKPKETITVEDSKYRVDITPK